MNTVPDLNLEGFHWSEDGYAALSGELLKWSIALDSVFLDWANALGAADHRFPTLIPASSLAPISYLKSFPHLATFAVTASRDRVALQSLSGKDKVMVSSETTEPVSQLLTPAACYHIYPRFAGQQLEVPRFLTTRCHCHRREERYLPLQRQWCFEMRELVCLGDADTVAEFLVDCQDRIDALAANLGIHTSWEIATDPFSDPTSDSKALAQRLDPTKHELCLENGLAIASINRHRSFFGECYDIRLNDRPINSACVAFGIERWLYAMLSSHGKDAGSWPVPGAVQ